jgi:hypothetical protein
MAIAHQMPIALSFPVRDTIGGGLHLRGGLSIRHPGADFIEVETPYAADFETWQSAAFQQTVDGYPMNI